MLATPERVREDDGRTIQVWHLLADGQDCDGQCDWHPIACSDGDGIVLPGGTRDVPLDLDEPGQRWCPDCLNISHEAALASAWRDVQENLVSLAAPEADRVRELLKYAMEVRDAEAIRREGHLWSGRIGLAILKLADHITDK